MSRGRGSALLAKAENSKIRSELARTNVFPASLVRWDSCANATPAQQAFAWNVRLDSSVLQMLACNSKVAMLECSGVAAPPRRLASARLVPLANSRMKLVLGTLHAMLVNRALSVLNELDVLEHKQELALLARRESSRALKEPLKHNALLASRVQVEAID